MWHFYFYGSVNRLGAGAGAWIYNLENDHLEGVIFPIFAAHGNIAFYYQFSLFMNKSM